MPIVERTLPTKQPRAVKLSRTHRRAGNARFVKADQKGTTAEFEPLLDRKADLHSKQVADPYSYALSQFLPAAGLTPVMPAFSFFTLAQLVQKSNVLRQCIESYVVNIESYGHVLEFIGQEGLEDSPAAQAEKVLLETFLANCSPTLTLRELRERSRWDYETIGNRFFEISRNAAGQVAMFDHLPGVTMYRTRRETEPVEVVIEVPNPADPKKVIRKTALRHFCRYVQMVMGTTGWRRVYFKEFGDPRSIDPTTGEVKFLPIEQQATEVLMLQLYTPGQVYGLPRWFGQLPSILGSRESEMVNLNFFRENAIPAMAVLISGGALTTDSFQVIEDYINALKGQKAMNRIMVLEASADDTTGSTEHSVAAPKIDMKPMISERQQDGLFKDYDQACQQKVRSSFRLPPIYAGRAEDYTRASAFASMVTAENQIFAPERQGFDDIMNNKILKSYRPQYWRYKSVGVPLADPDNLSKMLTTLNDTGALTPNAVIKIANKILDISIKPIVDDWGDYPFEAVMGYIGQGRTVPGLTEFIVDLEAEAKKEKEDQKNTIEQIKAKPANSNLPSNKPAAVAKQELERIIRNELKTLVEEMQDAIIDAVQVSARKG